MIGDATSRLRRLLAGGDAPWPDPEPYRPLYAVGDIHGRHDLLRRLLDIVEDDRARLDGASDLVFLGDYVDRGMQSAQALELLRGLQRDRPGEVTCLPGNHEDMMLGFLSGDAREARNWLRNGGITTLLSFGVDIDPADPDLEAGRADLVAAMEPGLDAWLTGLPLTWRSGDVVAAHAGLDPARDPDDQSRHDLLWGAEGFLHTPRLDGLWIVHGHVIHDEPFAARGRIACDTGAWYTERLTAARLVPGEPVRFLQTGTDA